VSSVILLGIVLAWAVVLVPLLLHRYDTLTDASAERLATAVRVLSRRTTAAGSRRYLLASGVQPVAERSWSCAWTPSEPFDGDGGPGEGLPRPAGLRPRLGSVRVATLGVARRLVDPVPAAGTPARARMLARRRRVLAALAAAAGVFAVLALAVRPVFWVPQVVCDVLLVAYLGWLRRTALRERAARARAAANLAAANRAALGSIPAARAGYAGATPVPGHLQAEADADATERELELDLPADDDGLWEPVPVPVPTYVTAAAAPAGFEPVYEVPGATAGSVKVLDLESDLLHRRAAGA